MNDYFKPSLTDDEIRNISSLGLAHVGDAVFELLVRTWISQNGKHTSGKMHRVAVGFVNAHAQAMFMEKLMPELTDEETTVFKRGRNAKVNSVPKNAEISDYHAATGLEALLGYLYLRGRTERINRLFQIMIKEYGDAS